MLRKTETRLVEENLMFFFIQHAQHARYYMIMVKTGGVRESLTCFGQYSYNYDLNIKKEHFI